MKNNQAFIISSSDNVSHEVRLLAKQINCVNYGTTNECPCGSCQSCLEFQENTPFNLHEMDADSFSQLQDIKQKVKVLEVVPYQVCPLCNGSGNNLADGFTSAVYQPCKVCYGSRIIPMYIIERDKLSNKIHPST